MTIDEFREIVKRADTISFAKDMRSNKRLYEQEIISGINEYVSIAVANELERIAEEEPINGNFIAQCRVLLAAQQIRARTK